MANIRLIGRRNIKVHSLINGGHMKGLCKAGNTQDSDRQYYRKGIGENIYIDAVARIYGSNNLVDIASHNYDG